jgi:hypothetical protein
MPKRRKRHSWALSFAPGDPELRALSERARRGVAYATALAENAQERSTAALARQELPERLTADELGGLWDSPVEVHSAIKQARIELFGRDLGSSAIDYRLRQRRVRGERVCAEAGCERRIPALAHGSRRYCAAHRSGRARVARNRRLRLTEASRGA